jgi:hypothetical protein
MNFYVRQYLIDTFQETKLLLMAKKIDELFFLTLKTVISEFTWCPSGVAEAVEK